MDIFDGQIKLDAFPEVGHEKPKNAEFENFLRRFQRWSDREAQDESSPAGCCGYGGICDWCEDSADKNPCAKSLRAFLKESGKSIDPSKKDDDYYYFVFEAFRL